MSALKDWIYFFVSWISIVYAQYESIQALRLSLMHSTNFEFASIPLIEQGKYGDSGGALNVNMRAVISDVRHVGNKGLEAVIHLQSTWIDPRLKFNASSSAHNYTLARPLMEKVWSPDTYMEPEWNPPDHDTRVMKVFPGGKLITSTRIHATIPCDTVAVTVIDYIWVCSSMITSYSYDADDVELHWVTQLPIILLPEVKETESEVQAVDTSACKWDTFNEVRTSCLQINVHVKRSFRSLVMRMYVPSFMTCMMAWSSFWIHRDEVSARIKLGTLVVMTVMTEYITLEISFSQYLNFPAGNVWMLGCMTFTWVSFFLYVLIHVIRRREKAHDKQEAMKQKLKDEQEKKTGLRTLSITSNHPEGKVSGGLKGYSVWKSKAHARVSLYMTSFHLDRMCRVMYGLTFLCFNIIFWAYFGVSENRFPS